MTFMRLGGSDSVRCNYCRDWFVGAYHIKGFSLNLSSKAFKFSEKPLKIM